jgi:hypothetical protein
LLLWPGTDAIDHRGNVSLKLLFWCVFEGCPHPIKGCV